MTRFLRLIALTAALVAAVPASAHAAQNRPTTADVGPLSGAGAFVIQSCGETGSATGWTIDRPSPASVEAGTQCPAQRGNVPSHPSAFDQSGIWVSDRLGNAGGSVFSDVGDRAEVTFNAQPGTSITRLRYWRKILKTTDDNWQPYIAATNRTNILETCEIAGQVACQVGADDWYPNDPNPELDRTAYADRQGLNATSVILGLACRPNPDDHCIPGYSIPYVEAQIYSAFFTITDTGAPSVATPGGSLWTTTAWLQGDHAVTIPASDTTGIAATRLYVDGSLSAADQRDCTYDRPRPCTDEPGATVSLPTASLADGSHTLQVAAVDAAGNETRETRSTPLLVDNTPPAAPPNLTSPAPTSSTNNFSATWSLPSDQGSSIVSARYQLCQNGTCGPAQTAADTTSATAITLPAPGRGTLRVWLVDQLGHANSTAAAELPLTYAPITPTPITEPPSTTPTPAAPTPAAPKPPLPPAKVVKASAALRLTTLRRVGRRVTVAGTLASKASGRVTIRYRACVAGHSRIATKSIAITKHRFRSTFTLSRTTARAPSATVTVSYRGDADTRSAARTATIRFKR
jgi:hypothetical protein